MQISDRWHQIFGTLDGLQLSAAGDCNAFGLWAPSGLILFDAGAGGDLEAQRRALTVAGFGQGPAHLLLTHGHADHSGGAAALVEAYHTRLYAGALTADWLSTGDETKISLPSARRAGIYATQYQYRPAATDTIIHDLAAIRIDDVTITPLATPGHSADHFSYLVQVDGDLPMLVAGDAVFANGTIVLQDTWDCSVADSCQSIRRLATIEFDALLPGHGPFLPERGRTAVETAMARIERLLPPLNFV